MKEDERILIFLSLPRQLIIFNFRFNTWNHGNDWKNRLLAGVGEI